MITCTSAGGDVANLVPVLYNLSGTDAVAHVRETVKGSEARGDALALSFRAPRECSESQVTARSCGEAVTEFQLQTSVTASFEGDGVKTYAIKADNSVQYVRVASAAFLGRSDDFDSPAVSGFFQLSYGGETTGPLGADASPTVVRHALEALAGVGSVAVSRDFSAAAEPLTACAAETGHPTLVCAGLTAATAPQPADLISVGGSWYAVADAYDPAASPTEVHLALASSAAVDTSYGGETAAAVDVYAWAGGHEWAVEFLSNPAPAAIASPAHALVPTTASVGVRPLDCDECVYATGLAAFGLFYVRARAINDLGPGPLEPAGAVVVELGRDLLRRLEHAMRHCVITYLPGLQKPIHYGSQNASAARSLSPCTATCPPVIIFR